MQSWLRLCSLGLEFCSDEDSFNKAAPLSYFLLSQTPPHKHAHTNNHVYLRKLALGTAIIIAIRLNISAERTVHYLRIQLWINITKLRISQQKYSISSTGEYKSWPDHVGAYNRSQMEKVSCFHSRWSLSNVVKTAENYRELYFFLIYIAQPTAMAMYSARNYYTKHAGLYWLHRKRQGPLRSVPYKL